MNNHKYLSGKYNLIDKYRHFLRLKAKRYLSEFENSVVLGEALINGTYILVFTEEDYGRFMDEDLYDN